MNIGRVAKLHIEKILMQFSIILKNMMTMPDSHKSLLKIILDWIT